MKTTQVQSPTDGWFAAVVYEDPVKPGETVPAIRTVRILDASYPYWADAVRAVQELFNAGQYPDAIGATAVRICDNEKEATE